MTETHTSPADLSPQPDFESWLKYGRDAGWVSEIVCDTHEGLPRTEEEQARWDEGEDPCEFAMRVWE